MSARHLIVHGRVQGVGFRYWTVRQARAAGLSGWVRNRPDGTVEIHAEGEADALAAFEAACHHGPAASRVYGVTVEDAVPVGGGAFVQR